MRRFAHGHRSGVNRLYRLNHSRKVVGLRGGERRGLRSRHRTRDHYKGWGKGARAGGARPGRRMEHYHMRRRYLHAGLAGGAAGMYGMDENALLDDDPFADEEDFLDEMETADIMAGSEFYSESDDMSVDEAVLAAIESDSDENESVGMKEREDPEVADGAPPLQSEDHCHVFFYHSSNADDQDQIEHYVSTIENSEDSPHDLKVMTNERDFKADLSLTSNILLGISLSQRIVLVCSQEFVESDLAQFESVAYTVMSEEDRRNRLIVLCLPDVELPASLSNLPKIFHSLDPDCHEALTKLLSSGAVYKDNGGVQPSAPPLEKSESRGTSPSTKDHPSAVNSTSDQLAAISKEPSNYPNGAVIRRVTAGKYKQFEVESNTPPNIWDCPCNSYICLHAEPEHKVPAALTRRGLQITDSEFESILRSLSEASKVSFFQKAVDCSLPALFLATMVVTAAVSFSLWFLVTGALHHHNSEDVDISGSIFWSFMILVLFLPATVSLVMLAIVIHLVNYKYLKYRIKIEELNKRFRETNLVLHCQRAYWSCSSRTRLYFIYYNFEPCQQTLYCHVHDSMTRLNAPPTAQTCFLDNTDSATLKLDKIMKRVNTLTKKFEWDYFEALTTNKLPTVDEKEHRKKGMCFCQYVIHRELEEPQLSVVESVKYHFSSVKRNAFRKSHRRKSQGSRVYLAPYRNGQGMVHYV